MLNLDATILIQLAVFLVVMVAVNVLVFKPLGRLLDHRESVFKGLESEVSRFAEDKRVLAADYSNRMEELKRDILSYRSTIKEEIDREKAKIIENARYQAGIFLKREEENLKESIVATRKFLHSKTREVAEILFSKILGRPLGGDV